MWFLVVTLLAQIVESTPILYSVAGSNAGEFFSDSIDILGDVNGDNVNDLVAGAPFGAAGGRAVVCSGRDGRIIHEFRAQRQGLLGWEVANAGDLDFDRVDDVMVSAPADGGPGAVFIYSGRTGALFRTLNGNATGDRFGERIARLNDVNGDFVPDLIVGAPMADANGRDSGAAYVFSGATGDRIATIAGTGASHFFGSAVGMIHDVDGDGTIDIVISAYGGGSRRTGEVAIFSGRTRERLLTVNGEADGATFGRHYIGEAGDVDGDGLGDIITADIGHRARGSNTGRAYVISSRTGEFLFTWTGTQGEEFFGTGSKRIHDMNGDGVSDFFVGAAFDGSGGNLAGKAYVYSGRDGTLVKSFTGSRPGATFGARGISPGDVNGDGLPDLLVTAPTDTTTASQVGRFHVISGATFPRVVTTPAEKRRRAIRG